MINKNELKDIVYALTLRDRPVEWREKWLKKGFKKINRNPAALINYWESRLNSASDDDVALLKSTLSDYKDHLEKIQSGEALKGPPR